MAQSLRHHCHLQKKVIARARESSKFSSSWVEENPMVPLFVTGVAEVLQNQDGQNNCVRVATVQW